jgi:opacity protein-like surface antigen
VAGGANLSAEHAGVQVAGGLNASRSLTGVALAPLNVHRRVKGLQLGLVNIAEEVDGAALGIISYAKNGRLQPTLWTSTEGSAHVALKSVVGYAFTQFGAGVEVRRASFTYDAGVGGHLRLSENLFLEPGVHYSGKHRTEDASGAPEEQRLHYLAQLGYRVGNKVDLLVAAGARHVLTGGDGKVFTPELRLGVALF